MTPQPLPALTWMWRSSRLPYSPRMSSGGGGVGFLDPATTPMPHNQVHDGQNDDEQQYRVHRDALHDSQDRDQQGGNYVENHCTSRALRGHPTR